MGLEWIPVSPSQSRRFVRTPTNAIQPLLPIVVSPIMASASTSTATSTASAHVLTPLEENAYVDARLSNDERSLRKASRRITELIAQHPTPSHAPHPNASAVAAMFNQEFKTVKLLVKKADIIRRMEQSMRDDYEVYSSEIGTPWSLFIFRSTRVNSAHCLGFPLRVITH